MIVPTLAREWALWKSGARRVAGVDEVGMACLAGPVVAAALVVRPYCRKIPGVRDSKTLSLQQRERLYEAILARAVAVGVGAASVGEINEINILRASHLAMHRALRRVLPYDHALVDGRPIRDIDLGPYTAIVDGDALSYSIACASIVAKVTRDRLMNKLAARYPGYGWDRNVGYATRLHLQGIRERGLTPFHRLAYAPVRAYLVQPTSLDDLLAQMDAEALAPEQAHEDEHVYNLQPEHPLRTEGLIVEHDLQPTDGHNLEHELEPVPEHDPIRARQADDTRPDPRQADDTRPPPGRSHQQPDTARAHQHSDVAHVHADEPALV